MRRVEFETRISGIPSIIVATIYPEEGDNWNDPYLPARVAHMKILNMRGKPCKWREKRMTDADYQRIELEALKELEAQRSYV